MHACTLHNTHIWWQYTQSFTIHTCINYKHMSVKRHLVVVVVVVVWKAKFCPGGDLNLWPLNWQSSTLTTRPPNTNQIHKSVNKYNIVIYVFLHLLLSKRSWIIDLYPEVLLRRKGGCLHIWDMILWEEIWEANSSSNNTRLLERQRYRPAAPSRCPESSMV